MTPTIIIRPGAYGDLSAARHWYNQKETGLGEKFLSSFELTVSRISWNPLLYRLVYKNIRRAATDRFPYSVFFMYNEKIGLIEILSVIHQKRNIDALLPEMENK